LFGGFIILFFIKIAIAYFKLSIGQVIYVTLVGLTGNIQLNLFKQINDFIASDFILIIHTQRSVVCLHRLVNLSTLLKLPGKVEFLFNFI